MDGLIMILYYPYTFEHIKEHLPNSANICQRDELIEFLILQAKTCLIQGR